MNVVLSLGGNLGNVVETIKHAVNSMPHYGLAEVILSPFYSTVPIGCEDGTPDFINAAVIGRWDSSPHELLLMCRKLELATGRPEIRSKICHVR